MVDGIKVKEPEDLSQWLFHQQVFPRSDRAFLAPVMLTHLQQAGGQSAGLHLKGDEQLFVAWMSFVRDFGRDGLHQLITQAKAANDRPDGRPRSR
jgi:hypothetical protein